MKFRTWHAESAVVLAALSGVALATHGGWVEWLGAAAVYCGFCHASVAERLREREAARAQPSVECHRMSLVYFLAKEVMWFVYFVQLHAWSALVGCAIFMAYPFWRRWWRRRHPMSEALHG